jgi:hypothetical protein
MAKASRFSPHAWGWSVEATEVTPGGRVESAARNRGLDQAPSRHAALSRDTDAGVFLPDPPHDFVGRAETLETLYAALVEKHDKALLYGEPGCGKSMLALKFARQTQGAFDAVVFQPCGQRPVAEIAVELATKLELGVETRPPEEQIAAALSPGRRNVAPFAIAIENVVVDR